MYKVNTRPVKRDKVTKKRIPKIGKRGQPFRRILQDRSRFKDVPGFDDSRIILGEVEYFHATRGWKSRVVTPIFIDKMNGIRRRG